MALLLAASTLLGGAPAVAQGSGDDVDADWHTLRTPPLADGQFELLTLSTLPDTVTGGDVLVAIRGLDSIDGLTVRRNGTDITDAFAMVDDEVRGLVTGLPVGASTLEATAHGQVARLVVHNHPVTGPVISGPHQTPFRCETEQAGLGPALDADCSARTRYQWFYRSVSGPGLPRADQPVRGVPV